MSFSLKLAIAITFVILTALGINAAIGGPEVRKSYLTALRNTLVARVDGVATTQELRVGRAQEDAQRHARSSRLISSLMGSQDAQSLAQTAEDELRFVLERGGVGSTFLFLQPDGEFITSREGSNALATQISKELSPLLKEMAETSNVYLPIGKQVFEVILAQVNDSVEGEQLGWLVLCFPYKSPAPQLLEGDSSLQVGLQIGQRLYGTSLTSGARRTAEDGLASLNGGGAIEFFDGKQRQIAYSRSIVKTPPAQLVAITSLAPLDAAEGALILRMSIAAAVSLAVGLLITFSLARNLSRPIADMSTAARAIQSGDYTIRVPVRDRGELGALAQRFNEMGEGLALRDQYRRVLDVVADPEIAKELLAGKIDLGGRSQDVGILFCDIRGFTALTEHMDPPHVIEFLNHHMSLLTKVAYEHGGVVDKFVGDLIMVTFGTPKSSPSDAQRLAQCALAMIAAREAANKESEVPIRIGIGCAFGTVVAGCMGSKQRLDYTVLGARVNLAARLCSKAPAMRIYIDSETNARNPGAVTVALDPFVAKGFSAPILAFELQQRVVQS